MNDPADNDWEPSKLELQLFERYEQLKDAVKQAIDYANGRESEWGERAEHCFDILRKAIEVQSRSSEQREPEGDCRDIPV